MENKYEKWHNLKSNINALDTRPEFHQRDIWFCHLGLNIGDEQNGSEEGYIRPVVIILAFLLLEMTQVRQYFLKFELLILGDCEKRLGIYQS